MRETLSAINRVFSRHGEIAIAVLRNPLNNQPVAVITNAYVRIPVVPAKNVTYQSISKLLPELEDAVGRVHQKRLKLRFGSNPFCLEIPRITPEYTTFVLPEDLSPFEAKIGNTFQYGRMHDIKINLMDSNSAHVFVAGMVGCGKSNVLETFVLSMAYATNPDKLSMFMIDMKKRSLAPMADLPHVVTCASTEETAEQVCLYVFNEMMRRRDNTTFGEEKIVLVIDELRELKFADSSILKNHLPRIVALGREIGVHVIAATQKPSSSDLGSIVNSQFPIRIVGVVEDAQASYHLLKKPGAGAESLAGKGDMLISYVGSDPLRMQVHLVQDRPAMISAIQEKWKDYSQPFTVPASEAMPVQETIETIPHVGNGKVPDPVIKSIPEEIISFFWENYDENKGKLKHGTLPKIAEMWYGKKVNVAGHIYKEIIDLCGEIKKRSRS